MRKAALILVFAFWPILLGASCSVAKEYRDADTKTYEAVAPRYLKYLEDDKSLSDEDLARLKRTVETWKVRLTHSQ